MSRKQKLKELRKKIYGDNSQRVKEYKTVGGTRYCTGLRAEYLGAKKAL